MQEAYDISVFRDGSTDLDGMASAFRALAREAEKGNPDVLITDGYDERAELEVRAAALGLSLAPNAVSAETAEGAPAEQ
jgi:hypothetical protein